LAFPQPNNHTKQITLMHRGGGLRNG
jgi:hypothetical protein